MSSKDFFRASANLQKNYQHVFAKESKSQKCLELIQQNKKSAQFQGQLLEGKFRRFFYRANNKDFSNEGAIV